MIRPDAHAAGDALAQLEARLDPAAPELAGLTVLAYGEISAALVVADEPSLAGLVVKRMSGFRDALAAETYVALLRDYLGTLTDLGVHTVPTEPVTILRPDRGPTVFLLQPQIDPTLLGHHILLEASDQELRGSLAAVLDQVATVLRRNLQTMPDELTIDAQLSNWVFGAPQPVLLDVGTPFVRHAGRHAFDQEILLSAVPPGIRAYYRRKGTAGDYMDDYFDARLIAVDILGNFRKEGAGHRLPIGLDVVNEWLAGSGADLPQASPEQGPVTAAEVDDYYQQDAATLELFLKVRRLDRGLRRALRRPYDFILPGPVER